MKALVVYESFFGNTKLIAEAIAEGLQNKFGVTIREVSEAEYELLDYTDLLVLGGPTQMWGMSNKLSRSGAKEHHKKIGSTIQPISTKMGVRNWLAKLPNSNGSLVVAFDTRLPHSSPFPGGGATKGMVARLTKRGYRQFVESQSFLLKELAGPPAEGELDRAKSLGKTLAEAFPEPA